MTNKGVFRSEVAKAFSGLKPKFPKSNKSSRDGRPSSQRGNPQASTTSVERAGVSHSGSRLVITDYPRDPLDDDLSDLEKRSGSNEPLLDQGQIRARQDYDDLCTCTELFRTKKIEAGLQACVKYMEQISSVVMPQADNWRPLDLSLRSDQVDRIAPFLSVFSSELDRLATPRGISGPRDHVNPFNHLGNMKFPRRIASHIMMHGGFCFEMRLLAVRSLDIHQASRSGQRHVDVFFDEVLDLLREHQGREHEHRSHAKTPAGASSPGEQEYHILLQKAGRAHILPRVAEMVQTGAFHLQDYLRLLESFLLLPTQAGPLGKPSRSEFEMHRLDFWRAKIFDSFLGDFLADVQIVCNRTSTASSSDARHEHRRPTYWNNDEKILTYARQIWTIEKEAHKHIIKYETGFDAHPFKAETSEQGQPAGETKGVKPLCKEICYLAQGTPKNEHGDQGPQQ